MLAAVFHVVVTGRSQALLQALVMFSPQSTSIITAGGPLAEVTSIVDQAGKPAQLQLSAEQCLRACSFKGRGAASSVHRAGE